MEDKIKYYQTRHRLTIKQISELREFEGIDISQTESKQKTIASMFKVAELIRLSQLFKKNNLTIIPIKGPLLSWKLHKDFLFRHSGDLDILVGQEDLEDAIEMIKKEGYQSMYFDIPLTKRKRKLVLGINNHIAFFHPQKRILLEIHWHLITYSFIPKTELNLILDKNLETIIVHGETFTVFNKEFEFVYLVLHGAMHAWRRLKWLHDIYAYSKDQELDWDKVFILGDYFKARKLIYQALWLADRYWMLTDDFKQKYLPGHENVNQFIKKYPIERINSEYLPPSNFLCWIRYVYLNTKYSLSLFPGFKKASYIKRLFFIEREMDILILPDSLTFLYFVFRPINLIYRKIFNFPKAVN